MEKLIVYISPRTTEQMDGKFFPKIKVCIESSKKMAKPTKSTAKRKKCLDYIFHISYVFVNFFIAYV